MKGVIVQCLREMVRAKFGGPAWEAIMAEAGQNPDQLVIASQDFDDGVVLRVLAAACRHLGVTMEQAGNAFGDYWACEFAPRVYRSIYQKAVSARSFLLMMDEVHALTTRIMANARPPRFSYTWTDKDTLIMGYQSPRGLIDVMAGLARGVGRHYGERLLVEKLDEARLKIVFT